MATIGINWEDLPGLPDQEEYYVRMRVVSTDENRTSYWVYAKVENRHWAKMRKIKELEQQAENDSVV